MTRPDLPKHGDPWTEEEEDRLGELYPNKDTTELVDEFGRSYEAIKRRAQDLELSKSDDYQNPIEADGHSQQGMDAEERFRDFVEENGWTCFYSIIFRDIDSRKVRYDAMVNRAEKWSSEDADWYKEGWQKKHEQLIEDLKQIKDEPEWFRDLRNNVTESLEDWEHGWTGYPDFVVGDCPNGPWFVEVKYGSSNLMKKQIHFFEFLQSNGYTVKIFRVRPTGYESLTEWDGGWK